MRQLARDVAGGSEGLETARRALYRILNDGQVPTAETSRLLERGLGKGEGYFTVKKEASRARRDRLEELEAADAELLGLLKTLTTRVEALEQQARPKKKRA